MASKKISQLTAASPLTGTEPLPVVQGGVTVKTTVSNVASSAGSPIFQPDIVSYGGTTMGGIAMDMSDYSPIVFWSRQILAPNLITIYGTIWMNGDGGYGQPILNTISMPLVQTLGTLTNQILDSGDNALHIAYFPHLETIDFSSLTTIEFNGADALSNDGIYISSLISLTTLNIGSIQNCFGRFTVRYNPLLTTFSIANLTTFNGDFYADYNALTQATIDAILYQLAIVVNLANKSVYLNGGTNAVPSVTGAGYVATLISNGCTVTTN